MKIRIASGQDIPVLAEMNSKLIMDEGHRNPMSLDELVERMNAFFQDSYQAALFQTTNEIVGYCLWRNETDYVYIRQFFIEKNSRRGKLGKTFFDMLKTEVWEGRRLRLEVLAHNAPAIKFWRSMGFNEYALTLEQE